jgi:transcriptional regulator with XRE-family HTH domain
MNKALKSAIFLKFGTQEDFAAAIEERPSLVSNVIRGRRSISDERKRAWATALGCAVTDIFPDDHPISEADSGDKQNNSDSQSNEKEDSTYEKRFYLC